MVVNLVLKSIFKIICKKRS